MKKLTAPERFWVTETKSKEVQMMNLMGHEMKYARLNVLDCTMVELPYKGNRIVMQLILPRERTGVF